MKRLFRLAALPVFVRRVHRDGSNRWAEGSFEAIVVPGARVRADGTPSRALLRRVHLGIELHRAGLAPLLVLTGRGTGPVAEAQWMAEFARSAGLSADEMEIERHAMTTAENALYTARLVHADRILVATDDTHVRRCVREFSLHYPHVTGVGAPTAGRPALRQLLEEAVKEAWREA